MSPSLPCFPLTPQRSFAYPQTGLGTHFLTKKSVNLCGSLMIISRGKLYREGPLSSRQVLHAAELWDQHGVTASLEALHVQ